MPDNAARKPRGSGKIERVCVVGNGGWGTALALVAHRNGASVAIWGIEKDYVEETRRLRENPRYLPGVTLPDDLALEHDAAKAAAGADLILSAVPTQYLRKTFGAIEANLPRRIPVCSASKGVEADTFLRPTEILTDVLSPRSVAVLSGPTHAEEVARGAPTSVVVASTVKTLRQRIQRLFSDDRFRVYSSSDVIGVEIAAAVKNVIAIAAGVCAGLDLGDNAAAALITRGNAEITRLGRALGASPETFAGLAGIGDLITTCVSQHGRNRSVGARLGRGELLEDILASMVQVAEGVRTTPGVIELAKQAGVEMPISEQVHRVLFNGHRPRAALSELMTREPRPEFGRD